MKVVLHRVRVVGTHFPYIRIVQQQRARRKLLPASKTTIAKSQIHCPLPRRRAWTQIHCPLPGQRGQDRRILPSLPASMRAEGFVRYTGTAHTSAKYQSGQRSSHLHHDFSRKLLREKYLMLILVNVSTPLRIWHSRWGVQSAFAIILASRHHSSEKLKLDVRHSSRKKKKKKKKKKFMYSVLSLLLMLVQTLQTLSKDVLCGQDGGCYMCTCT